MKKRRNYIIFGLISVLTAAVIAGCIKHPLDQVQSGQYNTGNYWRNQADVIAGINGIYNVLYTEDWIGHHIYVFDDQSDDIFVAGEDEMIRNRYKIVRIGVNSAVVEDTTNSNQQTLPLIEELAG